MYNKSVLWPKLGLAAFLSVAVALPGTAASAASPAPVQFIAAKAEPQESPADYALFLKDKLGISLPETVTKGSFVSAVAEALALVPSGEAVAFADLDSSSAYYPAAAALYENGIISSGSVQAERALSAVGAVQLALKAAGLKELAYTYPESKVSKALAKLNLSVGVVGLQGGQELAAAVDTGLLPEAFYGQIRPKAAASPSLSSVLLGKALEAKGLYKHYLGYASDDDIYVKLNDAYRASDIIKSPELQAVVDEALKQDLVTGYNLKDSRYDANFVDSLALVYGHSDLTHAIQLIGLLRSEGIEAKVQFEPKTSAFIYLQEWGDPGVSDLYEVVQIENGNYIQYAKEYDIAFEFENEADKARFNDIVLAYAKKNSDDQSGLIASSWWQPLYYSLTELPDYPIITNNKIENGHYYAQSFSLKEDSADISGAFKQIDPNVRVITTTFGSTPRFTVI